MAALSVSFALFCTGLAYLAPQFCPCNKSSRSYVFITCRYSTRCSGVSRQFGICHLHYCIRPKYQSLATDSCRQVIYLLLCCFLTTGLILVNHAARYIKQINRTKTTWLGYDMFFPNCLTYERTRWLTWSTTYLDMCSILFMSIIIFLGLHFFVLGGGPCICTRWWTLALWQLSYVQPPHALRFIHVISSIINRTVDQS